MLDLIQNVQAQIQIQIERAEIKPIIGLNFIKQAEFE